MSDIAQRSPSVKIPGRVPRPLRASIYELHLCEVLIGKEEDIIKASKHLCECKFRKHNLVLQTSSESMRMLCVQARRMLLKLLLLMAPGTTPSTPRHVLIEAEKSFRPRSLLHQFSTHCLNKDNEPHKSTVLNSSSTASSSEEKGGYNVVGFGSHYFQYTPFKPLHTANLKQEQGKCNVCIMENIDDHPPHLIKERLQTFSSGSSFFFLTSRIFSSKTNLLLGKPQYRELNSRRNLFNETDIDGDSQEREQLLKVFHSVSIDIRYTPPIMKLSKLSCFSLSSLYCKRNSPKKFEKIGFAIAT